MATQLQSAAIAMGKGSEGSDPLIEIEGGLPVFVKRAQQHTHRAPEDHGGLADQAVILIAIEPDRWRESGVELNQISFLVRFLTFLVVHQRFRVLSRGVDCTL